MPESDLYTSYNVRNVSQKQIYDSYMGILRISPNKFQGKDVDDPTSILNTLVDFDGHHEGVQMTAKKNTQVKIHLTDSDGNLLPIYFIPKAFTTDIQTKGESMLFTQKKAIINMVTKVDAYTFVSNELTVRSGVIIKKSTEDDKKSVFTIATACDLTSNDSFVKTQQILLYPIEAPNDNQYFNNKNKLITDVAWDNSNNNNRKHLFNPNDKTPRHEQVQINLRKQPKSWFVKQQLFNDEHQVSVNNTALTTFNDYNEEIPILYTRDYVLGHYDGHSVTKNVAIGDRTGGSLWSQWVKSNDLKLKDDNDIITRLSWIRIDDLIWQAMDEILKGQVRHTKGRYDELGLNTSDSIYQNLFGKKTSDDPVSKNAPMLGQGVQDGIIMYHAMPLSRYWFHRSRQIVRNMTDWSSQTSKDDWTSYDLSYGQNGSEMYILQDAAKKSKITPCSDATISSVHSLSKDYVLCDGKDINFINYPNISLKNYNLFEISKKGLKVTASQERPYFAIRNSKSGIHSKISTSPELFKFGQKYPRFIRGLNWSTSNGDSSKQFDWEKSPESTCEMTNNDYFNCLKTDNTNYYIHNSDFAKTDKGTYDETYNRDCNGNAGVDIQKNITETKIHKYTFEYLTELPNAHSHKLFSNTHGGQGKEDYTKKIIMNFYRYSNATLPDSSICLFENPHTYDTDRGKLWTTYCLRNDGLIFDNYTPVPNLGLMLFNSQYYNPFTNIYKSNGGDKYKGTISQYENKWGSSGFGWWDGKQKWHSFTNNININNILDKVKIDVDTEAVTNTTMFLCRNHRIQKKIRKQLAMKINEAEARLPISVKGKAQFANYSHHVHYWKKKKSRWKRFFQAVIGFVVGSVLGFGLGWLVGFAWTGAIAGGIAGGLIGWNYKKKKWVQAQSHTARSNIGGYHFGSFKQSPTENSCSWQCLTSLPYTCVEYLGAGDIENLSSTNYETYENKTVDDGDDYYVSHNVTDRWNSFNVQDNEGTKVTIHRQQSTVIQNFNGEQFIQDINGPYPSFMNLIPLIKI